MKRLLILGGLLVTSCVVDGGVERSGSKVVDRAPDAGEAYCGDEVCQPHESCGNCESDCGVCSDDPSGGDYEPYCGDGICGEGEDFCSCSYDCWCWDACECAPP